MDYATPIGQEAQGEAAIYIDGNPEAGIEGSAVPAKAIEPGMRELIHLIRFAGLTPSGTDLTQVRKAIGMLIESASPGLATLLQPGLVMPDGTTITVDATGRLSVIMQQSMDPVGGIRFFEDDAPREGYVPCLGTTISNFSTTYPEMAAYLSTPYGAARLVTLAQYNALHTATWATLADGTQVGWDGIGGVTKFVWDKTADTLKMPDLQEMFRSSTGASLGVGDGQGDQGRNATGTITRASNTLSSIGVVDGVFSSSGVDGRGESDHSNVGGGNSVVQVILNLSRRMPTGPAFAPRRWGALACCYLGQPSS
mgnify:CR=1 FL=1